MEKPSLAGPEDIEANRIAGELHKLQRIGVIKEPDDLRFFTSVIRVFEGTFLSEGAHEPMLTMADNAPTRWNAKVLTGYSQPRTRGEHAAFLKAAFDSGDIFDLSNPQEAAEFQCLRRSAKRSPR